MFGKLKDKLKSWIGKVSEVEEKVKDKAEKPKKEKKEKKEKGKKEEVKLIEEHEFVEPKKKVFDETDREIGTKISEGIEKEEKKSFFKNLFSGKKMISSEDFKGYSEDLEMILFENNVAVEVSEKIIYDLKEKIVGKDMDKKEIENLIKKSLKEVLSEVLVKPFDLLKEIEEKKSPYVILFCGINGAGKTTTIAKFANLLKEKKISSVLAAGDTFRAASIEQLKKHGENLGINVINHEYGSDPASVGFDAIKYAEKNKIKAVLIDTAGRMHTAKNLLREMEKVKRVTKPDRVIFLGESITGNDSVDQVRAFDETLGIDGIILSKADIDEKGGTALSVGYITKKPILYLGTGQEYKDLEKFDKLKFIEKLGLD